MTANDLGVLFDEHVAAEMKKADIAGTAVVVVRDGAVLFARGYGHADVARKIPVSPGETLFRIASVSKGVTYTAVMQLVEQGKIDLDADIARYVDFPIPAAFGQPITMRHLMSHTAGFEETVQGRWVAPDKRISLRDYLAHQMPRRLFAPGTVPAYSTYGTTLAGYIVERVAGMPFETYMEKQVFAPLGMRHSSFAQPLPARLAPLVAKGYASASGPAGPFDIAQAAPAASMSSSPLDMGRFMLAHLGGATGTGSQILAPATLAAMHAVQYRHHPAGPGITLGLYEMAETAPRTIGHPGDIPGFVSAMYLFPAERTGLFVVQNSDAGSGMRHVLLKLFAERYLAPAPTTAAASTMLAPVDHARIPGSYRSSWRFDASPLALKYLLDQVVVRMVRPGTLALDTQTGPAGEPLEWHHVGANTWQSAADPRRRLYFSTNARGELEMSSSRNLMDIKQKSPWYLHKRLILAVLPASLLVVLLSVAGWTWTGVRRHMRRGAGPRLAGSRARNVMHMAGLLVLAPWVVYAGVAAIVASDLLFVASPACGMLLRAVQGLAWLALAATIAALLVSLRTAGMPMVARLHQALVVLAYLGASVVAWQGGILFWSGRF